MIAYKLLVAWLSGRLAKTLNEDSKMPDDLIQPGVAAAQPVAAPADVIAPLLAAPAAAPTIDTNTLKALLLTLGHDIEVEWEHLVALSLFKRAP